MTNFKQTNPDGNTFGSMLSEPDMAPPYAASFGDDATWAVVNHQEEGKTIVAGLTETQALTIADYLNKITTPLEG